MKNIFLIILLISIKSYSQEIDKIYLESSQFLNNGNYLGYVHYLEKNKGKLETPELLGDAYSFVGNYMHGLKIYYNDHMISDLKKEKDFFDKKDYSNFKKINKNEMFEEIQKVNFLLVNEGHHRNFHRIFLRDNLKELYKIGFRNLFVEGVNTFDSINTRKYPIISTLLSYPEPTYGEMIREAKLIGFNVYGYDIFEETPEFNDPIEDWNYRENLQYKNILKQYNGKKSVVYGGYSHTKTQNNSKQKFLGALLKKDYKVLSIDQITFIEEGSKDLEKKFYIANDDITVPTFFRNDKNSDWDYTLMNPRTSLTDGKPNWLTNNKKKGFVKFKNTEKDTEVLVQVYKRSEFQKQANNCIPIYQYIEKIDDNKIPYYFSDKFDEILIIRNAENKILLKKNL